MSIYKPVPQTIQGFFPANIYIFEIVVKCVLFFTCNMNVWFLYLYLYL